MSEYKNNLEYKLIIAPKYGNALFNEYKKGKAGIGFNSLLSIIGKIEEIFSVNEQNKSNFSANYDVNKNNLLKSKMIYVEEGLKALEVELGLKKLMPLNLNKRHSLKVIKHKEGETQDAESRFKGLLKKDYEIANRYKIHKYYLNINLKSNDYKELLDCMKELSDYFLNNFSVNDFPKKI